MTQYSFEPELTFCYGVSLPMFS